MRRRDIVFHINKTEKFLFRAVPVVVVFDLISLSLGTIDQSILGIGLLVLALPALLVTMFAFVVFPFFVLAFLFLSELLKELSILLFRQNKAEPASTKPESRYDWFRSFFAIAWVCFFLIAPLDLIWHDSIWHTGSYTEPAEFSQAVTPFREEPIVFFEMTRNELLRIAELFVIFFIQSVFVFLVAKPLLLNPDRLISFPILQLIERKIAFCFVAFVYLSWPTFLAIENVVFWNS